MCLHYNSSENTVGKGEIAHNEQFLHFQQCFLPVRRPFCHFNQIRNCHLQTLSVWKSLKFVVWESVNTNEIMLKVKLNIHQSTDLSIYQPIKPNQPSHPPTVPSKHLSIHPPIRQSCVLIFYSTIQYVDDPEEERSCKHCEKRKQEGHWPCSAHLRLTCSLENDVLCTEYK